MKKLITALVVTALAVSFSTTCVAAYRFFTGEEWRKIDLNPYGGKTKSNIKMLMLKTVQTSSLFSGVPLAPLHNKDFMKYVAGVDEFYSDTKNRDIPLYFALKISVMKSEGFPTAQINLYEAAVKKKLSLINERTR